jgi:hypothetical protein
MIRCADAASVSHAQSDFENAAEYPKSKQFTGDTEKTGEHREPSSALAPVSLRELFRPDFLFSLTPLDAIRYRTPHPSSSGLS